MPYLMDEAEKALEKKILARTVLDCKPSAHLPGIGNSELIVLFFCRYHSRCGG